MIDAVIISPAANFVCMCVQVMYRPDGILTRAHQVESEVSDRGFFDRSVSAIMTTTWIMAPEQCEALYEGKVCPSH